MLRNIHKFYFPFFRSLFVVQHVTCLLPNMLFNMLQLRNMLRKIHKFYFPFFTSQFHDKTCSSNMLLQHIERHVTASKDVGNILSNIYNFYYFPFFTPQFHGETCSSKMLLQHVVEHWKMRNSDFANIFLGCNMLTICFWRCNMFSNILLEHVSSWNCGLTA